MCTSAGKDVRRLSQAGQGARGKVAPGVPFSISFGSFGNLTAPWKLTLKLPE